MAEGGLRRDLELVGGCVEVVGGWCADDAGFAETSVATSTCDRKLNFEKMMQFLGKRLKKKKTRKRAEVTSSS